MCAVTTIKQSVHNTNKQNTSKLHRHRHTFIYTEMNGDCELGTNSKSTLKCIISVYHTSYNIGIKMLLWIPDILFIEYLISSI